MNIEETNGAQRAAAFLLSLDKESAANVIRHLDEGVIVEVVEAMAQVDKGAVDSQLVQHVEKELIRGLQRPRGARVRSESDLRQLLEQTLGVAQAKTVFEKIHQRLLHERPFIAVEKEPAPTLAASLGAESDAVVALVLAHFDPELSGQVLGLLPEDRQLEVVRRMATLVPPGFGTLDAIARVLQARIAEHATGAGAVDPAARLRSIAEVLNNSEPNVGRAVLDGLDESDAEMAAQIREFMFTWEDLGSIDRRSMQKVLATVDTRTLALALKGASQRVQDNVIKNLSARVREMVEEERELAGSIPSTEIQAMRAEVMTGVRGLMATGEFRPGRMGDASGE